MVENIEAGAGRSEPPLLEGGERGKRLSRVYFGASQGEVGGGVRLGFNDYSLVSFLVLR